MKDFLVDCFENYPFETGIAFVLLGTLFFLYQIKKKAII